jgi:hypothetical protein
MRRIVAEHVEHYHLERNHQGLANELIEAPPQTRMRGRTIQCGSLSSFWQHAAGTKRTASSNGMRKVAVTITKKSAPTVQSRWFSRNVRHVWDGGPRRFGLARMGRGQGDARR